MRSFSITYPQLVAQAVACGFTDGDLARIRATHEVAMGLVDGIYRKQGAPFLCHLVRTASIAMAETRSIDVTLAALVHAAYFLHCFSGSRRRGPRQGDRLFLKGVIGEIAEALVRGYPDLAWNRPGVFDDYAARVDVLDKTTRRLVTMKLCNELEDHLDAAPAFLPLAEDRRRYLRFGKDYVALARALGRDELAADLDEAMERCRSAGIPPALLCDSTGSFELRTRLWLANPIERLGSALRRRRSRR